MSAPDRLQRTLTGVVVVQVALVAVQLAAPPLRPLLPTNLAFLVLFAAAALLARAGRPTLAAGLVLGVGGSALVLAVAMTGGPLSRSVHYLPLLGVMAWSWLGRRVATAATAAVGLALCATMWLPYRHDPANHESRTFAILVGLVVATWVAATVLRDVRRQSDRIGSQAADADREATHALADEAARDRFLASVSHELRTPLETVLGYADLLREDEPDPERVRDLERIREAGRQLSSLVDDILDMSTVGDELTLTLEAVAPASVTEEVVRTAAPLVERGRNRLFDEVPPELPALLGDRRRVRQILLNLVSNSAKYTSDGTIRLSGTADETFVHLTVTDTGIGIPAHRLPDLFEPFVQLHEGTERRPGVGLGLALSRRLAQRMRGELSVVTKAGVGSAFTVSLPRAP